VRPFRRSSEPTICSSTPVLHAGLRQAGSGWSSTGTTASGRSTVRRGPRRWGLHVHCARPSRPPPPPPTHTGRAAAALAACARWLRGVLPVLLAPPLPVSHRRGVSSTTPTWPFVRVLNVVYGAIIELCCARCGHWLTAVAPLLTTYCDTKCGFIICKHLVDCNSTLWFYHRDINTPIFILPFCILQLWVCYITAAHTEIP
jgi:hypothetical protein